MGESVYTHVYTIEVHPAEEGEKGYWVSVPALPGCFSQADTYEEAVSKAQEAIQCYLEALMKRGEPVPAEPRHPTVLGVQVALPQAV
jgi:predicted RNase H-like HicB family nuclease